MLGVTNGDGGDSIRNVLDPRTSDDLAYSGRVNWAFLQPIGYTEGALGFDTCSWYGEVGAWGYYYADRTDKPHTAHSDFLAFGADLALGYGGFSFTGAISWTEFGTTPDNTTEATWTMILLQLGFHFPGTPWEVAARWSTCDGTFSFPVGGPGDQDLTASEIAFGVNYYLNGHGNKLQLDLSIFDGQDGGFLPFDAYAGIANSAFASFNEEFGVLLRFQWQLAL
jgi:hypothetical protein